MKVSYEWLQSYFDSALPKPKNLAELLTHNSFEVEKIENRGKDSIIEIDVLPNRAHDCLSHRGIAKEISTIINKPLKNDPLGKSEKNLPQSRVLSVTVKDSKLCRRFSAAVVRGVKVGHSPQWLKQRLEAIGQKSINNIVDATNYVMFDIGQPLHAFDMDKLEGKGGRYDITVRVGEENEKITTLDGSEYAIGTDTLLITDGNSGKPIGIAGVKGGRQAEVNEHTQNIIIEAANFSPANVRRTSQKLKLRTDASTRFENEPAQELTSIGLQESLLLIQKIAGGDIEGHVDFWPLQRKPYKIGVSLSEINVLLGSSIKEKEVDSILDRFHFEYIKVKPLDAVLTLAPTLSEVPYKYGASISYDAPTAFDCSSFVGFLFAQAGVSLPRVAVDQFLYGLEIKEKELKPGDVIFSRNNNNTSKKYTFKRLSDGKEIEHSGPKKQSFEFLSGTEVPEGVSHNGIYMGDGMVIHASSSSGVMIENINRSDSFKDIVGYRRMATNDERYVITVPFERLDLRIREDLIEEIGRMYGYENIKPQSPEKTKLSPPVNKKFYYIEKVKNILIENGFSEIYTRTFQNNGKVELINAFASDKSFLRENLYNSILNSLLFNIRYVDLLGLNQIKIFEIGNVFKKEKEYTSFAIGIRNINKQSGKETVALNEIIDLLSGELNTKIKNTIKDNIIEIDFDALIDTLPELKKYEEFEKKDEKIIYKSISHYPFVLRDIAVLVPKSVKENDIIKVIKKESGGNLFNLKLFDVFEPASPADKEGECISYAFRLVFQSHEKTLLDEEVNKIMKSITVVLNQNSGWKVR